MYLFLAVAGFLGLFRRGGLATWILLAIICSETISPGWSGFFLHADCVRLAGLFFTGALFCINAGRIPVSGFVLAILIFACVLLRDSESHGYLFVLTTAYAKFWLAYVPRMPFSWLRGDYSYGVYLWGYPCQQMVVSIFGQIQPMTIFVISLPMALMFAILSWKCIEKPALSLK